MDIEHLSSLVIIETAAPSSFDAWPPVPVLVRRCFEETLSRNKKNRQQIKWTNAPPPMLFVPWPPKVTSYIREPPQICVSNNAAGDIKLRPSCLIFCSVTLCEPKKLPSDFKSTLLWMPRRQVCITEPCHHVSEFAHLCLRLLSPLLLPLCATHPCLSLPLSHTLCFIHHVPR